MHSHINFGYPWALNYGHLILAALLLAIFGLGWARKWSKPALGLFALAAAWALTAWVVVRFGIDMNGRATLPSGMFLQSGYGKVLDMGAGTGRSTLMVLEARPQATVVALDLFGESYEAHFGQPRAGESIVGAGHATLLRNLHAAGVEQRATVQSGDMRHMPFEAASFDAIVSAYAIDHLNREGITQALGEARRVLKPRGELLLMVIAKDRWLMFTFGPLIMHAHTVAADFWTLKLREAGFEILEEGTQPATKYILARKTGGAS